MLSDPQKPYRREAGVRFLRVSQEGAALLRDSTDLQIRKSQDRSAGYRLLVLAFLSVSTHLEPRF